MQFSIHFNRRPGKAFNLQFIRFVMFIINFTHNDFQQIFQRNQSVHTAVFIHDNRHLNLFALHFL